jgi:hypothetical protein
MMIHQLKERRLIDKDQFIRDLETAKGIVRDVATLDNNNSVVSYMEKLLTGIQQLIEHQEEVKIDD